MSTTATGTVSPPKATDGQDLPPVLVGVAGDARTRRLEAGHKVPAAAEFAAYHDRAARDVQHTRRKTPFPRLPPELISKILTHLLTTTTAHNPHLHAALFVSRTFHACALPLLWRAPRIGVRVAEDAWRGFVRAIKRNAHLIEEMEDVWLIVGYDDEVDDGYSLPTALGQAMASADNMRVLRLHLHSDIPVSLPWQTRLRTLVELEIRMRVTDEIVDALLRKDRSGCSRQDGGDGPAAPCLQTLTLHCSALSDAAIIRLLTHNTPSLRSLTILQTQPSRSIIPRLSPATILPVILSTHQKLTALHIMPLANTQPAHLARLPAETLRALSLTLSLDLTLRAIATRILPALPKLSKLAIAAPPQCPNAPPAGGEATLVEEEELMRLPDSAPALRALGLKGCELVRLGEYGMREVYGVKGMPWMVDEFVGAWRRRWPAVKLMVGP